MNVVGGCGLHEAHVYYKHMGLTSGGGKGSSRHRAHSQRAIKGEKMSISRVSTHTCTVP